MATSCPAIGTDAMLEFCLMPWVAFGEEDITVTQIAVAAKVSSLLASAKRFEVFDNFICSLPERVLKVFLKNEQFRRALIDLRRQQERHEEICELIKTGSFADGSDLLEVWDQAHYATWEKQYRKPLSSLTRFRIRKRNPPPPSICRGGRPTRKLDDNARALMLTWFHDHSGCPYPGYSERELMAQQTGLTHAQIRTWFANARRRRHQIQKQERRVAKLMAKPTPSRRKANNIRNESSARRTSTSDGTNSGEEKTRGDGLLAAAAHYPAGHRRHQFGVPPPPSAALHCLASPPARLPAALGGTSPTGLQGLMCMYNRLKAQGPSLPANLPSSCHPPASHPYKNHSVHPTLPPPPQRPRPQRSGSHQPAHLLQPCAADLPVSSSRMMGPPICRQTRGRPSDLAHDQQKLLPLLAQQGSDAPAQSPSSSSAPRRTAATPPVPKRDGTGLPPPRWRPDGTRSSETRQLPQQTGAAASAQSARRSAAAGVSAAAEQLHQIVTGITSLPAQASVQSATVTRATPLTSGTSPEAALSSVLSQLNPTAAGAWVAGGTVAHEMLGGAGCSAAVTRDQCLAMWNASTAWFNAAQNALVSPTTAAFAETSQDTAEQTICMNPDSLEHQVAGFSLVSSAPPFLWGEFSLPQTPETFLVFQPTASSSSCLGPAGTDVMMGNGHTTFLGLDSPMQSSVSLTEGQVDEVAAQILLDLSTTKTCS